MTARSITLTHDGTSSALASQTWEMAFPTPVQFTSFVTDIATADTYALKIDGSAVVSGVVATAAQTNVTFTPGSPVSLSAGVHTFQLIGTASRAYYALGSNLGALSGDTAYAIMGVWQESATRQVPGTINFTEDGSVLPSGMERNASTGTARAADTWDVTFDSDVAFTGFLWFVQATDTYKLSIDGVDVATGVSGVTKRFADFRPASPVTLTAGTHTFSISGTAGRGAYFRSGTTPVLGSAHVTTWDVWVEAGGSARVAGLMGFALSVAGDLTPASTANANTATSPTLTQTHELAPANSVNTNAATQPALTQTHELTPGSTANTNTAGSPTLGQTHELTPANTANASTSTSPTFSLAVALTPADTFHGNSATTPSLTQTHVLIPANTSNAHTTDVATLAQTHALVALSTLNANTTTTTVVTIPGATPASRTSTAVATSRTSTAPARSRTSTSTALDRTSIST